MAADPYLAVTLDAKRRIAQVARALDQPHPGPAAWGLLELLEDVWRRKDPAVSALVLAACFGPDPRWPPALVEIGFLVPALATVGAGWVLHPTEADRLLLTHAKRVAAGKARAGGAKRGAHGRLQRSTSTSPAHHQHVTSTPPAADQLLQPAASSQQPAADQLPLAGADRPPAGEADLFGAEGGFDGARTHTSNLRAEAAQLVAVAESAAAAQLRGAWNELTFPPLQRWREGPGRNGSAAEALKRRPLAEWREVFRRIGASRKLAAGIGESCWRPDPDWAIRKGSKQKPEPALKALEGGWDDVAPGRQEVVPEIAPGRAWTAEDTAASAAFGVAEHRRLLDALRAWRRSTTLERRRVAWRWVKEKSAGSLSPAARRMARRFHLEKMIETWERKRGTEAT